MVAGVDLDFREDGIDNGGGLEAWGGSGRLCSRSFFLCLLLAFERVLQETAFLPAGLLNVLAGVPLVPTVCFGFDLIQCLWLSRTNSHTVCDRYRL